MSGVVPRSLPRESRKIVKPWRHAILVSLKLTVSAGLIFWLFRDAELDDVFVALTRADVPLLLVAFTLFFFGYLLVALRWQLLLKAQNIHPHLGFLIQSFMVALFFNNFLPSTVGGDAVRIYDSWRVGGSKSRALVVVFVDRLLGVLVLLTFAAAALLLSPRLARTVPVHGLWIGLPLAGMLAFVWMVFALPAGVLRSLRVGTLVQWVARWRPARKLGEAFLAFHGKPRVLAKGLLLSLVLQANVILHYYLISLALGLTIPLSAFFLIIPVAIVVMMLPVSINGIGLRESTYVVLFALFGVTNAQAIAFAWISYGFVLVQGLLGGLVYVLRK